MCIKTVKAYRDQNLSMRCGLSAEVLFVRNSLIQTTNAYWKSIEFKKSKQI